MSFKNETLGGIAKKYGVSTTILQSYNGIKNPNLLFVEEIKIPSSTTGEISYTVKKGDSLGSIAARFGVKQSLLAETNNIQRPDLIKIGQKLKIPLNKSQSPPVSPLSSATLKSLNSISARNGRWEKNCNSPFSNTCR